MEISTKKELIKVGAGRSASKMAHSHSWQVSAGCRQETSVPHHIRLPECPHHTVANLPQSGQYKKEYGGNRSIFYALASEAKPHHFSPVLLVTQVSPV